MQSIGHRAIPFTPTLAGCGKTIGVARGGAPLAPPEL
jgi:hypothetical protein